MHLTHRFHHILVLGSATLGQVQFRYPNILSKRRLHQAINKPMFESNQGTDSNLLLSPGESKAKAKDLNVGEGSTIKLDDLGPMVVNTDGTLSRIANWSEMTELEKANTLRVLKARNRIRLADQARKQSESVS